MVPGFSFAFYATRVNVCCTGVLIKKAWASWPDCKIHHPGLSEEPAEGTIWNARQSRTAGNRSAARQCFIHFSLGELRVLLWEESMCACVFSTCFRCAQHHTASGVWGLPDISRMWAPLSVSFPSGSVYFRKVDRESNSPVPISKILCFLFCFTLCGQVPFASTYDDSALSSSSLCDLWRSNPDFPPLSHTVSLDPDLWPYWMGPESTSSQAEPTIPASGLIASFIKANWFGVDIDQSWTGLNPSGLLEKSWRHIFLSVKRSHYVQKVYLIYSQCLRILHHPYLKTVSIFMEKYISHLLIKT